MKLNIEFKQWDTFKRTIIFEDKTWAIINLTWSVIHFSVKKRYSDIEYSIRELATISNPTSWIAIIQVNLNILTGSYVYDIEWIDSTWFIRTFLDWSLIINNQVEKWVI